MNFIRRVGKWGVGELGRGELDRRRVVT